MQEIDKKISAVELAKNGLIINNIQVLPPLKIKTQDNLRYQRRIPYFKIGGLIYYQAGELLKWSLEQKVEPLKH